MLVAPTAPLTTTRPIGAGHAMATLKSTAHVAASLRNIAVATERNRARTAALPKWSCRQCGLEKPGTVHQKRQVYCSMQCMAVAYRGRLRGSNNPHWKNFAPLTCPRCGKLFGRVNAASRYCSRQCAWPKLGRPKREPKARNWFQLKAPVPHSRRCRACKGTFVVTRNELVCKACSVKQRVKLTRKCRACGRLFLGRPAQNFTCSLKCSTTWRAIRQQGEKSHRWQGGKTEQVKLIRGSLAYAQWRQAVYRRDNFTCRICGKVGGKLAAHHIRKFSDHPDKRFDVANGVTLCWSPCHSSIRGKEKRMEAAFDALVAEQSGWPVKVVRDIGEIL